MLRVLENCGSRADLDDFAQIHDRHPMGDAFHHRHVVTDEEEGDAERRLQFHHQVDNLCLHGNVQRRDGLIGDDQLRVQHKRTRYADALTLAAGELVWKSFDRIRPQADAAQNFRDLLHGLSARAKAVFEERLGNRRTNPRAGIKAGEWILKDHLDTTTHPTQVGATNRLGIETVDGDGARDRLGQPHDRAPGRGLAATGFSDQRQRFAFGDRKGNILDGMNPP
ncbi:hypothetical protein D3C71_539060 [compost metagenome]